MKNLFVLAIFLSATFGLFFNEANAAELLTLQSSSKYTPPPPRYSQPQIPDYGLPQPAYTPPPPPPSSAPVKKSSSEINLQELALKNKMPVLPDRIRYRNSRRAPTKIIVNPVTLPRYANKGQKQSPMYVQRQPKQPPKVYVPRRPTSFAGDRGGSRVKNFGPPRTRYI